MTVKEIKLQLDKLGITNYHIPNYNKQLIKIYSCALGDNFFDYGEDEPEEFDWFEEIPVELREELENNDLVEIIHCDDCCGCAGW